MNIVQEFAEETDVFGLNILRPHVRKGEKFFWICATIFFFALTARDLINLSRAYLNDEMITLVIPESKQQISFTNSPSVYFTLDESFLEVQPSTTPLEEMLEMFAVEYDSRNSSSLPKMHERLTRLNMLLLNHISAAEMQVIGTLAKTEEIRFTQDQKLLEELLKTYNFYMSNNISLADVQKITGASLCKEINVVVRFKNVEKASSSQIDPCNVAYINEVGFDGFAFKTSLTPLNFSSWEDRLYVYFDYLPPLRAVFDIKGRNGHFFDDRADSVVELQTLKPKTFKIMVRPLAVYLKSDKSRKRCRQNGLLDCTWKCVADAFIDCIGCCPTSLPVRISPADPSAKRCPGGHLIANSSSLSLRKFSATLATCFRENETKYWSTCRDRCFISEDAWCEKRTYSLSTDITGTNTTTSTIEVSVESFVYPIFQERALMDWETFVAQCGGSVGLYLGLSFAAVLHIPVFCLRQIYEAYWRRRNKSHSVSIEMKNAEGDITAYRLSKRIDELSVRFQTMEKLLVSISVKLGTGDVAARGDS